VKSVPVLESTRERILDGAAAAVALHGLAKLDMADVCAGAGLSRGTIYRHFPNRDAILAALAEREGLRLKERMLAAIADAPAGQERILVALRLFVEHVNEHPALQRLLETDPALVLRELRARFDALRAEFAQVLVPLLRRVDLVRHEIVTAEQLVDWMMRLMVSAFLFPDPRPGETARSLTALYRSLSAELAAPAKPRRRPARRRAGGKR